MHGVRRCRSKPFPPFRGSAYQSPMKSTGTFSRSSNHRTWARSFEAAAASTGDVLNDIARASHRRNSANFASAASHPVRVAPSSVSLRLVLRAIAARDARRARERTHRPSITAHRAGARRPLSPDPVPRVARARYLPRVPRARVPPPSARVSASARPPPARRAVPRIFPPPSPPSAPRARGRAPSSHRLERSRVTSGSHPRRRSRPIRSRRASSRRAFARRRPRVRAHKYRRIDRRRARALSHLAHLAIRRRSSSRRIANCFQPMPRWRRRVRARSRRRAVRRDGARRFARRRADVRSRRCGRRVARVAGSRRRGRARPTARARATEARLRGRAFIAIGGS